ncbi:MAG: precorrin-2 C(20)-methyltransferase [Fusobacteriaceae bacterium]
MNKFYGIGVGVGDPSMLTYKAVTVLKKLDVVILPEAKSGEGSTAYQIAKEFLKDEVEKVFLEFPMVKDLDIKIASRKRNAVVIEKLLSEGKNVGFLTIGDPMIYSTFSYVLEHLNPEVEMECICGIPTFVDMASLLGIPLTLGDESLKIVSLNPSLDLIYEIESADNIVFMKLSKNFDRLKEALIQTGHIDNAIIVSNCGKENQKIFTDINNTRSEEIEYFSTMILKKGGISKWKKSTL